MATVGAEVGAEVGADGKAMDGSVNLMLCSSYILSSVIPDSEYCCVRYTS
jgi:hypothetical protein